LPARHRGGDAALLSIMGSPDARQIDGLGGADTLTSKVGIVRRGTSPGVDLEFLFAQVSVRKSAGRHPRPIAATCSPQWCRLRWKRDWCCPAENTTTLRVLTRNTGTLSDIEVLTPGKQIQYAGSARIDGVPGTSAPINISFPIPRDLSAVRCCRPDAIVDRFDEVDVTCIDNGMPVVIHLGGRSGVTGYESAMHSTPTPL